MSENPKISSGPPPELLDAPIEPRYTLKSWYSSSFNMMRNVSASPDTNDYGRHTESRTSGSNFKTKMWDRNQQECEFTWATDEAKTNTTWESPSGGSYKMTVGTSVYNEFFDPGDDVAVGGNLDLYYIINANAYRIVAYDTQNGIRYYQRTANVQMGVEDEIRPMVQGRSRAQAWVSGKSFESDAYDGTRRFYGFYGKLSTT